MATLVLTPRRLMLLRAIAAGQVYADDMGIWNGPGDRCTRAVADMVSGDWVRFVDGPWSGRDATVLTDTGRQVLDGAR